MSDNRGYIYKGMIRAGMRSWKQLQLEREQRADPDEPQPPETDDDGQ